MTRQRNLSFIGILILTTVLWGTAVSAHQHLDLQHLELKHELCDICLLPHAANTAPETVRPSAFIAFQDFLQNRDSAHAPQFIPPYQGRAPPRKSS